jgi:hypothetical protein
MPDHVTALGMILMRTDVRRRFGVADGLILVAATAVGLAARRWLAPDLTLQQFSEYVTKPPDGRRSLTFILQLTAELSSFAVIPGLVTWTLACLLLRLRRPRPPWRRLSRQPGTLACLIATVAIGLSAAFGALGWVTADQGGGSLGWLVGQNIAVSPRTGAAVFWCWVTMALRGRWRPEPTWLDRLCRLLGFAWLAMALVFTYAYGSVFMM